MDPGFSAARNQPLNMQQIGEFLEGMLVRDQFIVNFTTEFQARERRGEEYVVWVEHFDPNRDTVQFFYDDGDELSDEYPDIICRPEDITSIRKI
jgi:hypothetical protein